MIYDEDINKILVPSKSSKYFISYRDAEKVRPLCIMFPNMSTYRRDFDETTYMSFSIKNG